MAKKKEFGFDSLLALNGDRYFIDDKGEFEAIFKVINVSERERFYEKTNCWHCQL